jgi:hypothetical protein
MIFAGGVLAVHVIRFLRFHEWSCVLVPVVAFFNLMSGPAASGYQSVNDAPGGLVVLASGFLVFGIGTIVAIIRHRWHLNRAVPEKRIL